LGRLGQQLIRLPSPQWYPPPGRVCWEGRPEPASVCNHWGTCLRLPLWHLSQC